MVLRKVTFRIDETEDLYLENLSQDSFGILGKQDVLRLLIRHAQDSKWEPLTRSDTLLERAGASVSNSSSTSKKVSKSNKEKGRKRAEVSPEFEVFWKTYQRCQKRVPSQSKAKAWEEWKKAIKHETPERITKALERAVYDAVNCDWDYKLPDCFRWLRDGRYSAVLEIPEAAVTNPKIVICDETF